MWWAEVTSPRATATGARPPGARARIPMSPVFRACHSSSSMRMRLAGAAHPARTRLTGAGRLGGVPRNIGREYGQFLLQLRRAAVRAFGSLPVGGAHQDFAIPLAFVTMKF